MMMMKHIVDIVVRAEGCRAKLKLMPMLMVKSMSLMLMVVLLTEMLPIVKSIFLRSMAKPPTKVLAYMS